MLFDDLPLDVIHYIFLRGAEDLKDAQTAWPPYSYPLKLTTICKQWTEAALACPALWSTICIHKRDGRLWPSLEVAERWIERSGSYPLSFSIGTSNGFGDLPNRHISQAVFAPHYSRWYNIVVPVPFPAEILPKHVHNPQYPLLREITVLTHLNSFSAGNPLEWERDGLEQIFDILAHAPRLSTTTFCLNSHSNGRQVADRLLLEVETPGGPWARLSALTLQINSFTPPMVFQVLLPSCPNLESLELHPVISFEELVSSQGIFDIVHHQNLRTLRFVCSRTFCICTRVLGHLTLPNLRELDLQLRVTANEAWYTVDIVVAFLNRSRCELETIAIDALDSCLDMDDSPVIIPTQIMLALPPSVRMLTVNVPGRRGEFSSILEALILSADTHGQKARILPRLRTLNLWIDPWENEYDSAVLNLLESHFKSHPNQDQGDMGLQAVGLKLMAIGTYGSDGELRQVKEEFKREVGLLGGYFSEKRISRGMLGTDVLLTLRRN